MDEKHREWLINKVITAWGLWSACCGVVYLNRFETSAWFGVLLAISMTCLYFFCHQCWLYQERKRIWLIWWNDSFTPQTFEQADLVWNSFPYHKGWMSNGSDTDTSKTGVNHPIANKFWFRCVIGVVGVLAAVGAVWVLIK